MSKLEQLLEQYGKTVEDLTFEYSELSDEELEAKFEELFNNIPETHEEEHFESDEQTNAGHEEVVFQEQHENVEIEEKPVQIFGRTFDEKGNLTITYELSHDDIRRGLYNLIEVYEEQDDTWYYIKEVYDEYFIMESYGNNKIYKQGYSVTEDTVALIGERVELFELLLTESEKIALEEMRANYQVLADFKASTELKEKECVLADKDFSILQQSKEYKEKFDELCNSLDSYSVDEIKEKANALLGECLRGSQAYAIKNNALVFSTKQKKAKKKPYGNLFDNIKGDE